MDVPARCQQLAAQVDQLEAQRTELHEQFQAAEADEKTSVVAQIRLVDRQVAAGRDQLLACLALEAAAAPAAGLAATFSGQATITTTHKSAPGPYVAAIQLGLLFDDARTSVQITAFPAIVTVPFDTPYGKNVTTVTKTGGGLGAYNAGAIVLPLTLRFDQSLDLPFYEEDSDLSLGLVTDPPGSPVDASGNVTLTGSGVFQKGFLGGSTGTLTITGTVTPVP